MGLFPKWRELIFREGEEKEPIVLLCFILYIKTYLYFYIYIYHIYILYIKVYFFFFSTAACLV